MLLDQYEEPLSPEEMVEFADYLRLQLNARCKSLLFSLLGLVASCAAVVPFLAGHAFHNRWQGARYLIYVCEGVLLWVTYCAIHAYYAWKDLRDMKRNPPTD